MTKQFWAIIAVVVVVLVGVFAISSHKSSTSSGGDTKPSNHITGKGQQHVTLLEYGDFQCPACASYESTVEQVRSKYANDIYVQFRSFPLTNLHPNAFAASRAAEAAALQGKFWEMHDKLYQENILYLQAQQQGRAYNTWITSSDPLSYFTQYAQGIGLNVEQFKQDFQSDKVNAVVNADLSEANKLGLTGTPTFFLDGKKLDNVQPDISAFSKLIDAEITKKGGTPPSSSTGFSTPAATTPSSSTASQQ